MSVLIQFLPSPPAYSGGITHTWMGESWMVDGEASVMMMAMISSNSPSRQGARTEFLIPELGFSVAAALRNSSWKNRLSPGVFMSMTLSSLKGARGGGRGGHTMPRRGLGWGAPPRGVGPSWPASVSSSGSVSLLIK